MDDVKNQSLVAVTVIGYNRLDLLQRLLKSLEAADYSGCEVPLILSIDCGGNEELNRFASEYHWPFGEKFVCLQPERLGLRDHIFLCGSRSRYFRGVILLEDDLLVSPEYYKFTIQALDAYENEPEVAEISLFSYIMNGFVNLPFFPLHNGADVYAMQSVSTSGECFTWKMWSAFENWLKNWDQDFYAVDLCDEERGWKNAWSKYYDAYLSDTGKTVITPYVGTTTNGGEGGTHASVGSRAQAQLEMGHRKFILPPCHALIRYDGLRNYLGLYDVLGVPPEETCLDIWGMGREHMMKKKYHYLLSTKAYLYPVLKSYGCILTPLELNIVQKIEGNDIFLYDLRHVEKLAKGKFRLSTITYHLRGFELRRLVWAVPMMTLIRIKLKLEKFFRIKKHR